MWGAAQPRATPWIIRQILARGGQPQVDINVKHACSVLGPAGRPEAPAGSSHIARRGVGAHKTFTVRERNRMFAQINHVAMCCSNWPMQARFYEAVFGLQASEKRKSRPISGANIGDGYVGLNINPLRDGYVGGLDHFGMTVDDVEQVMERARRKFPDSNIVRRPSTRPFAAYSAHDPDGNVFDLAEKQKSKLDGVYADQADQNGESRAPDRYIN